MTNIQVVFSRQHMRFVIDWWVGDKHYYVLSAEVPKETKTNE